jgi:hypothetical protein
MNFTYTSENLKKDCEQNEFWQEALQRIEDSATTFYVIWERELKPCPPNLYVLRNKSPCWRCLVEVNQDKNVAYISFFGGHTEYERTLRQYNKFGGKKIKF